MEKMITVFAEVAVATVVLFGLVALADALMQNEEGKEGVIYSGIESLVTDIFNAASDAAKAGSGIE